MNFINAPPWQPYSRVGEFNIYATGTANNFFVLTERNVVIFVCQFLVYWTAVSRRLVNSMPHKTVLKTIIISLWPRGIIRRQQSLYNRNVLYRTRKTTRRQHEIYSQRDIGGQILPFAARSLLVLHRSSYFSTESPQVFKNCVRFQDFVSI